MEVLGLLREVWSQGRVRENAASTSGTEGIVAVGSPFHRLHCNRVCKLGSLGNSVKGSQGRLG
jgi:hypothetical protein